jgi:hypothetical protein
VLQVAALPIYGAAWLAMVGPRILPHMGDRLLAGYGDEASVFVWSLEWWARAWHFGGNPLLTDVVWAPTGMNLAWVTTLPGPAVVISLLTRGAGPIVAFNVLALIIPPLAAWTAFLLLRRLTDSVAAALVGGLVFGFSPVVMREILQGHLNLSMVFVVPLVAYLVVRLIQGTMGGRAFVALLTVALVAQFSIFIETFATLALVLALLGLLWLLFAPAPDRGRVARVAGLVALAYALATLVVSPYLYTAFAHPDVLKPSGFTGLAMGLRTRHDLFRFVVPRRGFALAPPVPSGGKIDLNFWYFGIPLLIVMGMTVWARRRTVAGKVLGSGFVVILLLALGPSIPVGHGRLPLPWALFAHLPLIGRARPGRLAVYDFLIAAVAVAVFLNDRRGSPRRSAARWALGVASVAVLVPNVWADIWVVPVVTPPFIADGSYRTELCRNETVLVVDRSDTTQVMWQSLSGMWFRTVTWYEGFVPADYDRPALALRIGRGLIGKRDGPAVRGFVAAHGVTVVLVRHTSRRTVALLSEFLETVPREAGGVMLLRVAPCT